MNTPYYPLKTIKALLRAGQYIIKPNALASALDDFGWDEKDIIKCLLKLNDRDFSNDHAKNHFYKTDPHRMFPNTPNTMMDYYKAYRIMEGFSVYTHIYIHPSIGKVVISSFKELQL